ncbi:hypothetical protein Tco_1249100 [Tanacetum coccineum]
MFTMIRCRLLCRFCDVEEGGSWGGIDRVDSFCRRRIRVIRSLFNDGCIRIAWKRIWKDDAGEILGVHSQGDCGNVTTDDNEDVTPVIAPEKDSIIAPPSTPPGNDLNIAVESGSSWIDYIGPLTSDEIDSDKRWSYRDPMEHYTRLLLFRATTFVERLFS